MSKTRNNKNFEFDSGKILTVTHVRDRNLTEGRTNLTESRISPNAECSEVPKCGLNTRHDNREVTLSLTHLTQAQILRSDK